MAMPGKHRHADEIPRRPVVAHAVDDAVTITLQNMDDRFHRVAMAQSLPAHSLFFARRDTVDPETKSSVIETQARIDEIKVRVVLKLGADLLGLDLHGRLQPALHLFLGEANRFHYHPLVIFGSKDSHNYL